MVANQVIETQPVALSVVETSPDYVKKQVEKIRLLQKTIQEVLVSDVDYGKIPGCGDKPTLFKSGAEKVCITFGLQDSYELVVCKEEFEGKGFFSYTVKCFLSSNGIRITEGLGHCNSKESKFAFKWVTAKKLPPELDPELLPRREKSGEYGKYFEYRVEEDCNSKANTILKMAKKRAKVDAVLAVANLSELFTQDFDDLLDDIETPQDKVQNLKEQLQNKEQAKKQAKKEPEQTAEYICSECGKTIQETVFEYSQKKYSKPLCYNCQQKLRAKKAS